MFDQILQDLNLRPISIYVKTAIARAEPARDCKGPHLFWIHLITKTDVPLDTDLGLRTMSRNLCKLSLFPPTKRPPYFALREPKRQGKTKDEKYKSSRKSRHTNTISLSALPAHSELPPQLPPRDRPPRRLRQQRHPPLRHQLALRDPLHQPLGLLLRAPRGLEWLLAVLSHGPVELRVAELCCRSYREC